MCTCNARVSVKVAYGLFAFVCLAYSSLYAAEIHVDVQGQDSNPGTKAKPVATLHAAQRIARQHIANGLKQPVSILIGEGSYYLNAPLKLTPEDSGTAKCPVTWRAAEGKNVLLSGGIPIAGTWKEETGGGWSVAVPGVAKGWNFRQLFVDGSRAIRARFPNADEANPFLYATGGDLDHAMIDPVQVKASWGTAPDAQINIVPKWKYFNQWSTVSGVNTSSGRIDFDDSERHGPIIPGNWFWIEGVMEELDQPGEWYLNRSARRLYYMPESGKDPNDLDFIAPFLNQIVYAKGDVNAGTHVEYVNFAGLEFRHTTFTLGHIAPRVHTEAAIIFENTCDSSVKNCHIENIGGYAFWLHLDSKRNTFDQNTVLNSGGGGVLMTGSRLSYMDDSKVYTPGEAAAKVAPILNRVTRNTVKHCGQIRYYGGGVHLDSRPFSMSMAPGNYIAHNHFNDLSRNGIFAFRNQGGHVIEYNHIHDTMQTTIDGACVHFATMNHLNAPNFILNNWLYDVWGYQQMPNGNPVRRLGNGIFNDWATSNTTVKENYIYNTATQPIFNIMGNWNLTIEGNHWQDTRIVPPFVDEVGPNGTATHGIDLNKNRLTGSVVHYSDSDLVTFTGSWKPRTIVGAAKLFTFH